MDYESFRSTVLLHSNSANFTKVELNKKVKVNFSSHVLSEFIVGEPNRLESHLGWFRNTTAHESSVHQDFLKCLRPCTHTNDATKL